jgi:hypothetical protein
VPPPVRHSGRVSRRGRRPSRWARILACLVAASVGSCTYGPRRETWTYSVEGTAAQVEVRYIDEEGGTVVVGAAALPWGAEVIVTEGDPVGVTAVGVGPGTLACRLEQLSEDRSIRDRQEGQAPDVECELLHR